MKKGIRVICIDALGTDNLSEGKMYTIKDIVHAGDVFNLFGVTLFEAEPNKGHIAFWSWRFRPIDEDFAENVLRSICEEIKADEINEPVFHSANS